MVLGTGIDGAGTVELLAEEHPGQLMREGKPRKADLPGSGRLYPRGKTKAAADDKAQAAAFLHLIETKKLQHIVAAHLSAQNNLPELAVQTLATALGCTEDWIGIADQQQGFNWRELA